MPDLKFALPLAVALMSGCAVGPEYERPPLEFVDDSQYITESDQFDPTVKLRDDWWKLYQDEALNQLVEQALSSNRDLEVARANLMKARSLLSEEETARLPSTQVSGGVTYGDATQSGGNTSGTLDDEQWSRSAGLSVAWELDLFGKVDHAIEAASASAQAVAAARDAVRVAVVSRTTRAYLDACSYAFALSVAEDSLRVSRDQLRLTRAREDIGAAVTADVERAQAVVESARSEISDLQARRQTSLLELAAVMGATPADIPAQARACNQPPEPIARLPVGDATDLIRRRPDLRQAERNLAADSARVNVAMADRYPSIRIGGSANYLNNDVVDGSDSFSYFLGPLISWEFPNMEASKARVRQAEAQARASVAAFEGQVINAISEVEQALTFVASEQRRNQSLARSLGHYQTAYEQIHYRYKAGSVAYVEVLVAQQDMLNARSRYAQSVQRLSSYRVDLFKALGGGWQQHDS